MIEFIRYSWIPAFFALIIFYLCCLLPTNDMPEPEFDFFIPLDKIVHFLMYFGTSLVSAVYYVKKKDGNININILLLGFILIPVLYGGLIEIVQSKYYPPRSGDWFDFLADLLGSLASLPFVFYYRNFLLKKYSY